MRKKYCFLISIGLNIFCCVSILADSLNVRLIGSCPLPSWANNVVVRDNYAYVTNDDDGLRIINISNPTSPYEVGFFAPPGTYYFDGIAISGNYVYVGVTNGGLWIIDISNPSSPYLVGSCSDVDFGCDIVISGNYAYVADYSNGLQIINITNPSSPSRIGRCDLPHYTYGLDISGNYAYMSEWSYGLRVINISNVTSPFIVAGCSTRGSGFDADVSEDYVYLAHGLQGIRIINIANPASPFEIGNFDTPGCARRIAVAGTKAYVADENGGLRIIDISNPSLPSEIGFHNTYAIYGLAVSGNYIYAVGARFYVFQFYGEAVEEKSGGLLGANITIRDPYPNPFKTYVEMIYNLSTATPVKVCIYDGRGKEVITLVNRKEQKFGLYKVKWNGKDNRGRDLPVGIYFCQFETDKFRIVKKIVKVK